MTIKIGSNIGSLQAQRRVGEATSSISNIYERLSSGQRINKASDDAAGLAIATDLNTRSRVFTQAVRNANDGISLLNIADSATQSLSGIVIRVRELTEQSANGTYSNKQRSALDTEAQALSKEYTRIAQTTSFNGLKLFDGSLGEGVKLQLGIGEDGSINASVGGAIGTGTFESQLSTQTGAQNSRSVLGDVNGDGNLDILSDGDGYIGVSLGNGDGTFQSRKTTGDTNSLRGLADLNGDGFLDIVGTGTLQFGNGDGTFNDPVTFFGGGNSVAFGDINSDGNLDILVGTSYTTTALLGDGRGVFKQTFFSEDSDPITALSVGDLNRDGILDYVSSDDFGNSFIALGNGNGTFKTQLPFYTGGSSIKLGDLNGDGILDIVAGDFGVGLYFGNGDGTFKTRISAAGVDARLGVEIIDVEGDGISDLVGSGFGTVSILHGNGNGTFSTLLTSFSIQNDFAVVIGDLNGDGVKDLVVGSNSDNASVFLAKTKAGISALLDFSLKTRTDALQATGVLDRALQNLAKQRGIIGSYQSRLSVAISNLTAGIENFKAAESRIKDTDIAKDAADLVRTQILQQAASSVLAQANQQPQLALSLLR